MASWYNKNPSTYSLINAILNDDLDAADALLDQQQCDVNEQGNLGYTPLLLCCVFTFERPARRNMYMNLFRKIMAVNGIDVNLRTHGGKNALMLACGYGLRECVKLLLSNPQCNICLQNNDGLSALHYIFFWQMYSKNQKTILRMFMDHCRFAACAALLTNGGFSALDLFLMNPIFVSPDFEISVIGNELLSDLLSKGKGFRTSQATMALAVKYAGFDTCRRLHAFSFNCDSTLQDNETAAHCAAQLRSKSKLDFILRNAKGALEIKWKQRLVDDLIASTKHEIDCSKNTKEFHIYQIRSFALTSEMINTKMFREADKHTSICQQNDILFAVKNCKLCKFYEEDFKNMANAAIAIAKHISDKFACDTRLKHLVFTPILSGSMAEGTKCFLPDEVDIVCRLNNNDNIVHTGSVDHTVGFRANSALEHLCNSLGNMMPCKLNRDFVNAVDIVIQEGHDQLSYEDGNYSMILGKFALQFEDKIPRLVVKYNSDRFQNLNISIDLAPALTYTNYSPGRPLPLHVKCNEYYALVKVSRFDEGTDQFPISYSSGEQALMASLPEHVRNGYILAKALRLTAICAQPGLNRKVFQLLEPIDIVKYISSYMLKNCMFVILQKIEDFKMKDIEPCRIAWADATYGELIHQLETERCIRVWYDKPQYLLSCTGHDQDIFSCCQKRRLILALSYQIRFWLAANRAQLMSNDKPLKLTTEVSILLKKI